MTDRTDDDRGDDPSDQSGGSDLAGADESSPTAIERADGDGSPSGIFGWVRWFWTTDMGVAVYLRDVLTSLAIVLAIGLVLFAISGVWPPMVAVESGSMEPNMERGDLVLIVDNERFVPEAAVETDGESTGVVPENIARETGETTFGGYGDVIVYNPNGNTGHTPIIHRAKFWVEEGENWYDRAEPSTTGAADNCAELHHCPAPNAGFITKGDMNANTDQATQLSAPVRPEWIVATAEVRVPYLGHVRLLFNTVSTADFVTSDGSPEPPVVGEKVSKSEPRSQTEAVIRPVQTAPLLATTSPQPA